MQMKQYGPTRWSAKRNGEEMVETNKIPSAIAAIIDEDLDFETPPEYMFGTPLTSLAPGLGQEQYSIPNEDEEFFSLHPRAVLQQQYGLPPSSLESQDSFGPSSLYFSLKPSQGAVDQSTQSFLQSHYGPHWDRLSSQDQPSKSLGARQQLLHPPSVQPSSLAVNRMQSSNSSGVRRVLQNMARAIANELHLD